MSHAGSPCRSLLLGNTLCGTMDAGFVQTPDGQRVAVEQGSLATDGSLQLPACSGGALKVEAPSDRLGNKRALAQALTLGKEGMLMLCATA